MKHTMVVIEDDASIREMLSYYFNSVGFDVFTFESGEEYFDAHSDLIPSIFILDIMLPNMDGFTILKMLRKNPWKSETPVILLTARSSESDRVKGLMAGGDDYVVKPFGIKELQARVNAVLRRSRSLETVIEYMDLIMHLDSREVTQNGVPLELTNKEFDLLCLLIRNRGRVMSREEILTKVWDYNFMGKSRTVDMHIKSLRAKLSQNSGEQQYIATVHGLGYKVN